MVPAGRGPPPWHMADVPLHVPPVEHDVAEAPQDVPFGESTSAGHV